MAGNTVDVVAGGARARAGWAEGLPIDAAHQGMIAAGGAPTGATIGETLGAGQLIADVAGQSVFPAKRVPMTGAGDGAAFAHRLLTFMAGQGMG
jgi:hypothetical protein